MGVWSKLRFIVALLAASANSAFAAPRVTKIEPPNWWLDLPNPMLLLTGEDLAGAAVKIIAPSHMRVVRTKPGTEGHYLLVWLELEQGAQPQTAKLEIQTPRGSTAVSFSIEKRNPASAGFRGVSGDDVIYLIMPDRFADGDPANDAPPQSAGTYDRSKPRAYHGGDLRGIRDHLEYLRDLGVTTIWVCPIYDNDNHSPEDYHGYGAVDFYTVDEHFGTLAGFQDLVAQAHQAGMKVLLDTVVNHTGMRHPWLDNPPEPDWYNGTRADHLISNGEFESIADPHAPPRLSKPVIDGWFFNVLPDLNQNNPEVAAYLIENSIWWAEELKVDGFRLDTFPYVPRSFWREYHRELHGVYPDLDTVGEVFNSDPAITSFFDGGQTRWDGIDSGVSTVFDFPLYFALRNVILKDAPATGLVDVLRRDSLYTHPEKLVTFIGNHDTTRFLGEPGATRKKLELAFSLLLTIRGIPQIYYGDEIGMTGGGDPENRHDFPGGFPGDTRNAFSKQERSAEEQEVLTHVERLLALRREHSALRRGRQLNLAVSKDSYIYARDDGQDRMLMAFNDSSQPRHFQVELALWALTKVHALTPLLDASPGHISGTTAGFDLAPKSLAIYEVK